MNPTSEQIIEALGRVTGRAFDGLEVCELEDEGRTLVLELSPAPKRNEDGEPLCLMVCPACGRRQEVPQRLAKQLACVCPGYPRMRRADSPFAGDPPEFSRPQDVPAEAPPDAEEEEPLGEDGPQQQPPPPAAKAAEKEAAEPEPTPEPPPAKPKRSHRKKPAAEPAPVLPTPTTPTPRASPPSGGLLFADAVPMTPTAHGEGA